MNKLNTLFSIIQINSIKVCIVSFYSYPCSEVTCWHRYQALSASPPLTSINPRMNFACKYNNLKNKCALVIIGYLYQRKYMYSIQMSLLNLTSDIYFFKWFNHFCRVYTGMYSDISYISLKFRPMHAMPVYLFIFFSIFVFV